MGETTPAVSQNADFSVIYNGSKYDVSDFLSKHPGGKNLLKIYKDKDISKAITADGIHEHSFAAEYILQHKTQIDEQEKPKLDIPENLDYEHLVDWKKPMVSQVGKLGANYESWVNAPVDGRMKLFGPEWMERLTNTPWWIIPTIYVPVILFMLQKSYYILRFEEQKEPHSVLLDWMWLFPIGVLKWTLFEYIMHRCVFHMVPPKTSPILITLHFLAHGIHHKTPFDGQRLVFPPTLSAIIAFAMYSAICTVYSPGYAEIIMAGFTAGYISYDMLHYYIHHGDPRKNTYLERLKHNHSQHHYVTHDKGYGVSVPMWDVPFQTRTVPSKRRKNRN